MSQRSGDRDVVVILHPDLPLVVAGGDSAPGVVEGSVDDHPATWPQLLAAARKLVPDGTWPLGPSRRVPGLRVHVVAARKPSVAQGYRWVGRPDPLWPESLRQAAGAALDEDAGRAAIHPLRAPWMRRGWWTEATDWVDARLTEAGRQRTGDLEPREHWGVSVVARVPATGGALWLKAVPPIFAREPAVVCLLAEHLPARVPRLFATEAADGSRYLTEDAGVVPDDVDDGDPPRLAALIADLQARTLDLLPRLAAAGCADRSPARLASELGRIAGDGMELDQLDVTERATLQRLVPEVTEGLLALVGGPLPAVLVHGDFHPWNVARTPGWSLDDAVVLDWTDAAIGPAGVDLATLLPVSADESARRLVRRGYASVWAARLDLAPSKVEAAVAAAVPAAHVAQALAYDEILRCIDPDTRWPFTGAMASHLRALLDGGPASSV